MIHKNFFISKTVCVVSFMLFITNSAFSADLPTAKTIAAEMGVAWNIGNTMEVPKDPTAWGNPIPTQLLIDSVKAGGFKTIRIPCAWDSHADQSSLVIDSKWMDQVKQVVDFCIGKGLYVILNSHWDGGWLEENVQTAKQAAVNKKQKEYWKQIATKFRDYDHHLIFAGANEPAVQDAYGVAFGADRMNVLLSYLQTFVDVVRETGGNNASRTLIVQGPRTDIELTRDVMTKMPTDKIEGRLMAEVHFYPYQFTLMETDADWGKVFYYWGKEHLSTTDTERNSTWCGEKFVDSMFTIVKKQFVDKGYPVLLGEFAAIKRTNLTGGALERHILSRRAYYQYVVSAALSRGIIPAAWDPGFKGRNTMCVFDRKTGSVYDLGLLNAIRAGAGMQKLNGDTSAVKIVSGNQALKILYSAKDSSWGQVELGSERKNMSTYESITVRAYVKGENNYDSAGIAKNGWMSMSLVTMSSNWTWREASLGSLTLNNWANYTIPISNDQNNKSALVPADPNNVEFFAIQMYSRGFRGTIYIDWITFKNKNGSIDTVYSFNENTPEDGKGNVSGVKMIPVSDVASDEEWKTATSKFPNQNTAIINQKVAAHNMFKTISQNGSVISTFTVANSGLAKVTLQTLQGRTIASQSIFAKKGLNTINMPVSYSGVMILQIQLNNQNFSSNVIGR